MAVRHQKTLRKLIPVCRVRRADPRAVRRLTTPGLVRFLTMTLLGRPEIIPLSGVASPLAIWAEGVRSLIGGSFDHLVIAPGIRPSAFVL